MTANLSMGGFNITNNPQIASNGAFQTVSIGATTNYSSLGIKQIIDGGNTSTDATSTNYFEVIKNSDNVNGKLIEVKETGVFTVPNTDIADITTGGAKSIITKEYGDANYLGGGSTTFSALTDTPASYAGNAGKFPIVNPTTDGLIYTADVQQWYADSPNKPIRWIGTDAQHTAKFGSGYVHPLTDDITILDGVPPAINASDIVFTPNGSIAAIDVQAAIEEVRDEAGASFSEFMTSSGTRAGGDILTLLGDYTYTNGGKILQLSSGVSGLGVGISNGTTIDYTQPNGFLGYELIGWDDGTYTTEIYSPTTPIGNVDFMLPGKTAGTYTLATTSDIPTNANYVDLTTTQTITGKKSFVKTTDTTSGVEITNNYSGLLSAGLTISNTVNSGSAMQSYNNAGGIGILAINNANIGDNFVATTIGAATGFNYVGQNGGSNTFTVNKTGDVVANTYNGITLSTLQPKASATATGTAIDMSGKTLNNFGAASAATVFTMTNIAVGGEGATLINTTIEPVVTGATKLPNTATWVTGTNMILYVKDFNGTRKFYFIQF
jgi:hypothetical protein